MFASTNNRNRQAYGKRRHARDRIIDSCFVSSPLKETKTIEIREDTVLDLLEKLGLEDDAVAVVAAILPEVRILSKQDEENVLSPRDPNQRRALRLSGGLSAKKDKKKIRIIVQDPPSLAKSISLVTEVQKEDSQPIPEDIELEEEEVPPQVPAPARKSSRGQSSSTKAHAKSSRTRKTRIKASVIPLASSTAEIIIHAQPLLSLCIDDHTRTAPVCFHAWADSLNKFFHVIKIAEASYGEVFRLSVLPGVATSFSKGEESVLKLIALKAPPSAMETATHKRKQAAMSVVEHVASEVRMLRRMSPVPGFTNFRDIKVVQGRLPAQFVAAWKHYDQNVKKSLFPDPSKKASYDETQLWAVVEMQDAGTDLEGLLELEPIYDPEDIEEECPIPHWRQINVWAAWDIFWSTAFAVAKGEGFAEFEACHQHHFHPKHKH
jgi:serine/threonine-protein kinase haspin